MVVAEAMAEAMAEAGATAGTEELDPDPGLHVNRL